MNLLAQMSNLQLEQQRHDDIAHRDILALTAQNRVKHMVLHFAKYSGHFADVQETRDEARFTATLVDTFIICLACANALNFRLGELLKDADLSSVNLTSVTGGRAIDLAIPFFPQFAKITGTMAKACESLDHFEKFDYHGTLERGLIAITLLCLDIAQKAKIDLGVLTRARWATIERKFLSSSDVVSKNESIRLAASKK